MDANKPMVEMADALVDDTVGMENLVQQIDSFAKRLGSSAEALGVTTVATRENAIGLLYLRDSLEKESKARRDSSQARLEFLESAKLAATQAAAETRLHAESVASLAAARQAQAHFNVVHGQGVPIVLQMTAALAAGAVKRREFEEETRRALGIFNAEDLRAKAAALEAQVIAIAQSGGSATQTVAKLGNQFEELTKVAAELGVQLSPQFDRAAEAIAQGPGLAMEDLFASFRGLPKEVEASRAASAASLDKMGKDLEGKVKGGFVDGVKDGIGDATRELEAWAAGAAIKIPVELDLAAAQRQLEELKSGRIPTTTGSAP